MNLRLPYSGLDMLLECKHCSALVDASVVGDFTANDGDAPPYKFSLARCPQCSSALLAVQEDYGGGWDSPGLVYPPDDFRLGYQVPEQLRTVFDEAARSFKAKAFTASAIMCRKSLEGLCVEKGYNTGNLAVRLKALRDTQIIESRLFEWADQLRLSGNDAAHDLGVTISPEEARDIMEFTQALLEYVYTFQARFEVFKSRRNRKS